MVTQDPLTAHEIGARGVLINSGFGAHLLVLVDGHSVTDQSAGISYVDRGLGIPMELIDHIEIILGPGSVLYGANAMLGVINIITKRARDYAGMHIIAEGSLAAPTDRQGTFVRPRLTSTYLSDLGSQYRLALGLGKEFRLFGKSAEITFQAEYFAQEGPALTMGPQFVGNDTLTGRPKRYSPDPVGTGIWGGKASNAHYTEAPAAYLRFVWGDFELNAHSSWYRRGAPVLNSWVYTFGNFDDPVNGEFDSFYSLDLKHRQIVSSAAELRSRLYFDNHYNIQYLNTSAYMECLPGQVNGCYIPLYQIARTFGLEEQLPIDWLHNSRLVTLLGFDGRIRPYGSQIDIDDFGTEKHVAMLNEIDTARKSLGAYAQQTARPVSWLSLNAGARADFVEGLGSRLSPRVAANVSPWRGGTLKGVYSEAFRAPSENEYNFYNPFNQVPAHNLGPESVRVIEGGIAQRWRTQNITFTAFRAWWEDMIVRNLLSADEVRRAVGAGNVVLSSSGVVFQYQNVSTIDNYGFSAAFNGSALEQRLEYGLNVTGAIARRDVPNRPREEVTVAPKFFGNANVSYDLQRSLPKFALAAHWVDSRPTDRAFLGGFTPAAYAPAQLQLHATISGPLLLKGLSYRWTTNYAFASFAPYVNGPIQTVPPGSPPMAAELIPVVRLVSTLGLQYDFGADW